MNRAMWLQRTHSLYSEQVRRGGQPDFDKDIDVSANRTWYPFQIAFILLNLPCMLTTCPWCGSAIEPGKHLDSKPFPNESGRTLTYCSDKFGQCLFSKRQAADEGLPVVVVDEEIYRRLPTLVIKYLDRSVLVKTIERDDLAFFG